MAKILTSFEPLPQEEDVILQGNKVFFAVCERAADVYSQEVKVIGKGELKCQCHQCFVHLATQCKEEESACGKYFW